MLTDIVESRNESQDELKTNIPLNVYQNITNNEGIATTLTYDAITEEVNTNSKVMITTTAQTTENNTINGNK